MPTRKNREAEIAVIRTAQPRSTLRTVVGATERRLAGAMEIPIEQVVPDPGQPRRDWGHDEGTRRLNELAASIREFGLLQPLLVREEGTLADGRQRYVIIAGERRHTAATRIGLATIPVLVRSDEAMPLRILQLIENVQRQDLSPLDEARAYGELLDAENLSPPMLAARLHLSPQHVRDRLRLISDQVFADAVARGQLSATAARDILQLPESEIALLRDRVRAGERVQASDVATVRERLAAGGIVNPRRKGKDPKKQTAFVLSVQSVPPDAAPSVVAPGGIQTVPVIVSDEQEDAKKQTPFVSSVQSASLYATSPTAITDEAPVVTPTSSGSREGTQQAQNDRKKQTPFVSPALSVSPETAPLSMEAVAIEALQHAQNDAKKQTPFVFGAAPGAASDAELLTFAAQIAEMIGERLSGETHARFLALLEATQANRSTAVQWWLLVDAHLRAQYGKPPIK